VSRPSRIVVILLSVVLTLQLGAASAMLATPKAAALAFVRAMEADDMSAFQAVTLGKDEDYKLFQPLLGMVGAAKQMEKAAREKFGKAGGVIVRDSPAVELEVHVQESDVKVTGDKAVLSHQGEEGADPLTLRHTAEGWKVDLTAIANRQQMATSAAAMARMRQALTTTAADIRAGHFNAPELAEQALLKRLREAASEPPPAAK
jgi:FlaG/FlaF family flagellin (archaellin)